MKKYIKKLLPAEWIYKLKKVKQNWTKVWYSLSSYNKLTSLFYYIFFSNAFLREQHAVLRGKLNYYRTLKKPTNSNFLLRRNIHRIEKGLLMKPRRGVFALDYIRETVEAYITSLNHQNNISRQELKWAHDVLEKYFEVTDSHPKINKSREKYLNTELKIDKSKQFIPYKRILDSQNKPTFDSFFELAKLRRSVRWFKQKKVPRELIDKAIEVASMSPSACNRQPFEYVIIDEKELLKKVVQLPMGTGGYSDNIPMMIISIGNLDAYFSERDRHLIYIDASLANMSLMYALETLGLSSCPINWPDVEFREKKMAELLNLKVHQRPIMCMAVGYPDPNGMVAYSQKKDLNLIRSYNNVD